jgi:hypothetical protein
MIHENYPTLVLTCIVHVLFNWFIEPSLLIRVIQFNVKWGWEVWKLSHFLQSVVVLIICLQKHKLHGNKTTSIKIIAMAQN